MKFKIILCLIVFVGFNKKSFGQLEAHPTSQPYARGLQTARWADMEINMRTTEELHKAAWEGNVEEMEDLLQRGYNINEAHHSREWAPIHWAAAAGKADMVEFLLDHGANIEQKSNTKETAFLIAARKGHINVINVLDRRGANKSAFNNKGETALILAVKNTPSNKPIATMERLIELGADPSALAISRGKQYLVGYKWSALHWASHLEIPDAINLLLDRGVDPDITNLDKDTPLLVAVLEKKTKSIEILMLRGADPDFKNIDGDTPRIFAIDPETENLIKQLSEKRTCYN